jgi:hypothetical protein
MNIAFLINATGFQEDAITVVECSLFGAPNAQGISPTHQADCLAPFGCGVVLVSAATKTPEQMRVADPFQWNSCSQGRSVFEYRVAVFEAGQ